MFNLASLGQKSANNLVDRHSSCYQHFGCSRGILSEVVKSFSVAIATAGIISLGQAAQAVTLTYSSTLGSRGAGVGQFNDPYGIAVSRNGNVYVTDASNNRIQVFNSSNNNLVSTIGSVGSQTNQFNSPRGVGVRPTGNSDIIYVADTLNNRIQVFNSRNELVSSFVSGGSATDQFNDPSGVAVNPINSSLYIGDTFNDRVQVFSITSTAVPFEFSPGLGVMALGTFVGIDRLRRRMRKLKFSGSRNT